MTLLFDRALYRARLDRAAPHLAQHDFLYREMASRLSERLSEINRTFTRILLLGARSSDLLQQLQSRYPEATIVQADLSAPMLRGGHRVIADEERLPFATNSFDLILATALHTVNDLPGALIQLRHSLVPDGLLMAIVPGGETLKELRHALTESSIAHEGGLSPRMAPYIDVRDAGSLLQRAGFAMPVADSDVLQVHYTDLRALMHDLRGMGETNIMIERPRTFMRGALLAAIENFYAAHHRHESGKLLATVELVTLTGWKPAKENLPFQ